MKTSASTQLKSNRKSKRLRKDDIPALPNEPEQELPVIDFESLQNELFDISYEYDRNTLKAALLAFIFKYGINLSEHLPAYDRTLLHWALESQYKLQFIDVVLELYQENNTNIFDFGYEDLKIIQSLMEQNLTLQAQLLVHYGASPFYTDQNNEVQEIPGCSFEDLSAYTEELRNAIHPGNVQLVVDIFLETNSPDTPLDGENNCLLGFAIYNYVIKPDLKYILQFSANAIDHRNSQGLTPLMIAIRMNDLSAVKLLMKHKPNLTILDNWDKSALDLAMECKRNDIFKLIYELAPKSQRTPEMVERFNNISASIPSRTLLLSKRQRTTKKPSEKQIMDFVSDNPSFGLTCNPTTPSLANNISEPHARHWIDSHPRPLQALAQKIINNIKHVSFAAFKAQIIACAQSLKLPREYILVLPEETDKSNPWVFSHALPHLSHLPIKVLKPSEIAAFIDSNNQKQYDFLFVDDAAFSGTQTKSLVDVVPINDKHQVHIHYLIPFMTKRAHELLQRHTDAQFGHFQTMEGISTLFTDKEKQILQENNVNSTDPAVTRHLNWPELTLTYFEHKIADWKSAFPAIMKEGRTINDINARLPFIPVTIEPYKSNPSLPLHTLQGLLTNQYAMGLPLLPRVGFNRSIALPHASATPPAPAPAASSFSGLSKFLFG